MNPSNELILLTAILGITAIECVALAHGINGVALAGSLSCLGGVCGWYMKKMKGGE